MSDAKRKDIPRSQRIYRSCTGCYESEDGHPVGHYPIHPKHGCRIGAGCHECQGRGFVRDRFAESFSDEDARLYVDDTP